MCRMPIEPAAERLYDPRAKVEHALRRMKPCSVGYNGRGGASLRPQARTSGRFRHEQRRHVRPPPDDHPPGARAGARSCTSRCWPRSMTTRARAAADRGGRARALLAPRRRGRELGPPRARPARADAGRAATFFTVEAGTFENYLPDEATLAVVRRRTPRSNYRRGPSGGPAMADPLSPPDRAWSPRARGRPGVPLAGFGDLQLGVDGKEAPDVGGPAGMGCA